MSSFMPSWDTCTQKLGQFKASYIDPYVPSQDTCLALATQTAQTVAPYLPQKGGAAAIARMSQHITMLQAAPNQAAVTTSTRLEVQQRKTSLFQEYSSIGGTYFEDPSSQIHQAWINFSQEEANYNSSSPTQFDRKNPGNTDASLPVSQTFRQFLELDRLERDTLQQIVNLGSTFKSDPELLAALREEKRITEERNNGLSISELPRAKSEYETSLSESRDDYETAALLDIYKEFQKQHKTNERTISIIDQMLNAPDVPDLKLDAIVAQKIQTAVQPIQQKIVAQQSNIGVDWKQTACYAMTGIVAPAMAYYFAPSSSPASDMLSS